MSTQNKIEREPFTQKETIKKVFSGAPWEKILGYCRAVQVGPWVLISGTTASNAEGQMQGGLDPYLQSLQIFKKWEAVLEDFSLELKNIVRTRIYVRNIEDFDRVAKAHQEIFQDSPPVSTFIEVSDFVSSGILVEMEADAYSTRMN